MKIAHNPNWNKLGEKRWWAGQLRRIVVWNNELHLTFYWDCLAWMNLNAEYVHFRTVKNVQTQNKLVFQGLIFDLIFCDLCMCVNFSYGLIKNKLRFVLNTLEYGKTYENLTSINLITYVPSE